MTFTFTDLDAVTRQAMLEEFESDVAAGRVYISARSAPGSEADYFDAQRTAFTSGDADSLSRTLATSGISASVQSDGKAVNIPDAAAALGDGQFVAYYSRAVCRRAIEEGVHAEVYRGQATAAHRPSSDALVGTRMDPATLLKDLRDHSLQPWLFASVGKVNSGLTVRRA
ncbi:hypothetical protein DEJ34_03810 [Curtobacterium sp. MCPF17_050]|uniref:hypothetical protein n=1 Tax=Curtobacterium sp. MCPF17_050 TaxID=2175664 RepID=UPI0011B51166|nr:hypothetical protein [Curtobacterium sp. MCPF17_050]WIB16269.1 hypothetical protein DEJ34_03810 [Curtobacterium sp. MCPF17_050]